MADDAERDAGKLSREAKRLRDEADLLAIREDMPCIVAGLLEREKAQAEIINALRTGLSLALSVLRDNNYVSEDFALKGVLEPKRR
jgi:hypothetical protein